MTVQAPIKRSNVVAKLAFDQRTPVRTAKLCTPRAERSITKHVQLFRYPPRLVDVQASLSSRNSHNRHPANSSLCISNRRLVLLFGTKLETAGLGVEVVVPRLPPHQRHSNSLALWR